MKILIILSNFKPKNYYFWPFLLEISSKIHRIGGFGCKKLLKLTGHNNASLIRTLNVSTYKFIRDLFLCMAAFEIDTE